MGIDEDARRGAVGHKDFVNGANGAPLFSPSVEFSIGKGAGPALPKAIIGIFDHPALAENRSEIKASGGSIFTPFENDRLASQFNTAERSKHAGGTTANNDDLLGSGRERLRSGFEEGFGRQEGSEGIFDAELHFDLSGARVDRVFAQPKIRNTFWGGAQDCGDGGAPSFLVFRLLKWQDNINELSGFLGHFLFLWSEMLFDHAFL